VTYCVNHSGEDTGKKVASSLQQTNWMGSFDQTEAAVPQEAVEKLVRFGQQVGVTAHEMISLLDSGIEMHDLLAFLASKGSVPHRWQRNR
jgi:hypothetical protein